MGLSPTRLDQNTFFPNTTTKISAYKIFFLTSHITEIAEAGALERLWVVNVLNKIYIFTNLVRERERE